jgi:hypothetical protein
VVNGQLALQRALTLRVLHTTLLPNAESITWTTDSAQPDLDSVNLDVTIERSLVGSIRLPPISRGCTILNSIVDGRGSQAAFAIAGSAAEPRTGPPAALAGVTLFGQVSALQLRASRNVIFVDQVVVQETQVGGITYSYVPEGSVTPRRFRCQPDLALQAQQPRALARVRPVFTSTVIGQPGYAQLGQVCPVEISRGGEDGCEMGAFCFQRTAKREANLSAVLGEYLNAGLNPGVYYVT